jgi:hypothetical protein
VSVGTVLLIVLVVLLLGGLGGPYVHPAWQPGYGYGWGANGLLGTILVIVLILVLLGRV